jgi:hypothetical protein
MERRGSAIPTAMYSGKNQLAITVCALAFLLVSGALRQRPTSNGDACDSVHTAEQPARQRSRGLLLDELDSRSLPTGRTAMHGGQ